MLTKLLRFNFFKLVSFNVCGIILTSKKFLETLSGLSISDFLIMNHWLNYAKLIEDVSYKNLCTDFIYSDYIIKEISNQLEFRRKEFLRQ